MSLENIFFNNGMLLVSDTSVIYFLCFFLTFLINYIIKVIETITEKQTKLASVYIQIFRKKSFE